MKIRTTYRHLHSRHIPLFLGLTAFTLGIALLLYCLQPVRSKPLANDQPEYPTGYTPFKQQTDNQFHTPVPIRATLLHNSKFLRHPKYQLYKISEGTTPFKIPATNLYPQFVNTVRDTLGRPKQIEATLVRNNLVPNGAININHHHKAQHKPNGWQTITVIPADNQPVHSFYGSLHLLPDSLAGINGFDSSDYNSQNVITATTQTIELQKKMVPPIKRALQTGAKVQYSAEPVYVGQEKLCRGIKFKAINLNTGLIILNSFVFNVQSGFAINYHDSQVAALTPK